MSLTTNQSLHCKSDLHCVLVHFLSLTFITFATGEDAPNQIADHSPGAAAENNGSIWAQDTLTGDWDGYRKKVEDDGITVAATMVGQGFYNVSGGISRRSTVASTFDSSVSIDAGKALNWNGAIFYADFENHAGLDPSQVLVGDLEKFTKLNYSAFSQISEIWYQQRLGDDTIRIKLGKVDANSEFSVIDNGLQFLSSSTQVSPTIIVFPTFPDPMPSANVFFNPNDLYYVSIGAYYANRNDRFLDFSGSPQAAQVTQWGMLFIGETGLKWKHLDDWQADGNVRVGYWEDTGTFTTLNGGQQKDDHGCYVIVNQTLWKPSSKDDEPRGARIFLEYAQTPGDISIIDRHIGGGLAWTGLFSSRPVDLIGLSPQYVRLSNRADLPKTYELAIEGFYQYQIAPWISLQPDLQYICNPGGRYSNDFIGTIQFVCHF